MHTAFLRLIYGFDVMLLYELIFVCVRNKCVACVSVCLGRVYACRTLFSASHVIIFYLVPFCAISRKAYVVWCVNLYGAAKAYGKISIFCGNVATIFNVQLLVLERNFNLFFLLSPSHSSSSSSSAPLGWKTASVRLFSWRAYFISSSVISDVDFNERDWFKLNIYFHSIFFSARSSSPSPPYFPRPLSIPSDERKKRRELPREREWVTAPKPVNTLSPSSPSCPWAHAKYTRSASFSIDLKICW